MSDRPSMTLSPGDRVDRYDVAELLGSGGMGEVYRAHDPKLDRAVALKILRFDQSLQTDGHARLLREARAVATLSHPNVLAVYDVGEVTEPERLRGLGYIAMELVLGRPLRAYVGDETIPIGRRLDWLRDVARALSAAHHAGVVHRDVKPENVMIRNDGIVKVLDFGVARRSVVAVDALTSTEAHSLPAGSRPGPGQQNETNAISPGATSTAGGLVGTLYYMAPEQLLGEAVDGRADQFAWGVVAYELLVGEGPWPGRHEPIKVVSQILSNAPRPSGALDGRVPPAFSEAIARALSRDPGARFPSMAALLARIDGARESDLAAAELAGPRSQSPSSLPSGAGSRPAEPRRRRWLLAAAGLVAVGVAALAGSSGRSRRERSVGTPPGAPVQGTSQACTSSAACSLAHGKGAWRCQSARHECVELTTVDCRVAAQPEDLANDETVWLGGLFPTTGDDAANFVSETRAIDLARQDFASALGSSAARTGELHARPIGVVLCDEAVDPIRAAEHLVHDVEAPAVIGFRSAQTALSAIPAVFLPNHVLSFISISQAADLNRIPEPPGEPRLVWRATLDSSDVAAPLAALVSNVLEPRLRATKEERGARERDRTTRVAVVRWSAGARGFSEAAFRALRFNGKSALENGDDFRQFVFDERAPGVATEVVDGLLAFRPSIVFMIGAAFPAKVLLPLEARWKGGSRPIYLSPSADFGPEVAAFVGDDRERRRRFFGATNVSSRMANAELVLRYNLAFPAEPVTRTVAPQPSYDAFYVLAYAALSLGAERIDGPSLSRAITRLTPDPAGARRPGIDVGPAHIFDAFSALRAGSPIDLNGAIGALDFDRASGEAPVDYEIVCLGSDARREANASVESGLVYEGESKRLRGTLRCP